MPRSIACKGYATRANALRKLREVIPEGHELDHDSFILSLESGRFMPAVVVRNGTTHLAFPMAHQGLYVFN